MRKALFLDRDGVININHGYVHKISDFDLVDGIIPLCQLAIQKFYQIVVITNQSGIARGMYKHQDVLGLHEYMKKIFLENDIRISGVYYCPHHPDFNGKCFCRKPRSLLFEKAIHKHKINPNNSWMVGDSERDLIPAKKLGMKTVLLGKAFSIHANICLDKLEDFYAYL